MTSPDADSKGFFGDFGGAYVPELLYANIHELQTRYRSIVEDESFVTEWKSLLRDYVGRPSPLYFSQKISKEIGIKLYLKREDLNHTGSHKINNALGQALLAKRLGKTRIIAETGAGQHGVATATACALVDLPCIVYMGEIDMGRQAPNVKRMKYLGADVVPATSGSKVLKDAANEAIRDWIAHPEDTHYLLGSAVGPHPFPEMVAYFQSIISEEIRLQLKEHEGREYPDTAIACIGGGSNAIGTFYHFLDEENVKLIGVEAAGEGVGTGKTAATIASGTEGILHGSRTLLLQTEDGQVQEAYSLSAGLDYPGVGPQHAHLATTKRALYVSVTDSEALEAAQWLSQKEGIIPALESAHALAYLKKGEFQEGEVVVLCLSGRGDKDMATYLEEVS